MPPTGSCSTGSGEQFVTTAVLQVDARSGHAQLASAGHPGVRLLRNGCVTGIEADGQLPLGLFETTRYQARPVQLHHHDRLLMISDGALEARDATAEEFGGDRLDDLLKRSAGSPPASAVVEFVQALRGHQQGELRDDVTVVILDWLGG